MFRTFILSFVFYRCYSVDDDIHEFDIKEPSVEKPLDASSNYFTDEDEKEKYIEKTIHSNLKASEKSSSSASSSKSCLKLSQNVKNTIKIIQQFFLCIRFLRAVK